MEEPLIVILHTHGIGGRLAILPRLYTLIKRVRARADAPHYLVDSGESCAPDVWPCDVTGGRAVLIALDAMGYDAAYVDGTLDDANYSKLADTVMMGLVRRGSVHRRDDLIFTAEHQPPPAPDGLRHVVVTPDDQRRSTADCVYLKTNAQTGVGITMIYDDMVIYDFAPLTPETLPDATISGAVDFIHDEARYYDKQRRKSD